MTVIKLIPEQRRLKVVRLAQAESRARQRYEALGMANTYGLTAEQRVEQDAEYAAACEEWIDALNTLREAIKIPERVR